jgi:hypothetical protein
MNVIWRYCGGCNRRRHGAGGGKSRQLLSGLGLPGGTVAGHMHGVGCSKVMRLEKYGVNIVVGIASRLLMSGAVFKQRSS